jgi:di/tricarboxylate transporter
MLGAMIPLLGAMIPWGTQSPTHLADLNARGALNFLGSTNTIALTATALVSAVAITPFVNNVSAAVALAPIATALAKAAGYPPEPFLLALAVGVSLDFLTPFGHHNNALVMSIGNYRFLDFARLGFPLVVGASIIALIAVNVAFG